MRYGDTDEPLLKRTFDRIVKSVLNLSGYLQSMLDAVTSPRRFELGGVGKRIEHYVVNDRLYKEVYRRRISSTYQPQ